LQCIVSYHCMSRHIKPTIAADARALRIELETMPPGTLVPRDWLLTRLASFASATELGVVTPGDLVDLSIHDLCGLFGRRPSTIRQWLERGDLPGAYRLRGREWRIPRAGVEAFQHSQRASSSPTRSMAPTDLSSWRSVKRRSE